MVHVVVPDPEYTQADETDDISDKLRPKIEKSGHNFHIGCTGGEVGDAKFQNEKRHGDGEYAVAERLNSIFPKFKRSAFRVHWTIQRGNVPSNLARAQRLYGSAARATMAFLNYPAQGWIDMPQVLRPYRVN